jgi:hypothetical protein
MFTSLQGRAVIVTQFNQVASAAIFETMSGDLLFSHRCRAVT